MFGDSQQTSTPLTSNKLSCSTDCLKAFSDLWVFLVPPRGKLSSMVAMFGSPKNNANSYGDVALVSDFIKAVINGQEIEPSSTPMC